MSTTAEQNEIEPTYEYDTELIDHPLAVREALNSLLPRLGGYSLRADEIEAERAIERSLGVEEGSVALFMGGKVGVRASVMLAAGAIWLRRSYLGFGHEVAQHGTKMTSEVVDNIDGMIARLPSLHRRSGSVAALLDHPNYYTGELVSDESILTLQNQTADSDYLLLDSSASLIFHPSEKYSLHPSTIYVGSFGKAFGLQSLRLGFIVSHPDTASRLRWFNGTGELSLYALQLVPHLLSHVEWYRAKQLESRSTRETNLIKIRDATVGLLDVPFLSGETHAKVAFELEVRRLPELIAILKVIAVPLHMLHIWDEDPKFGITSSIYGDQVLSAASEIGVLPERILCTIKPYRFVASTAAKAAQPETDIAVRVRG